MTGIGYRGGNVANNGISSTTANIVLSLPLGSQVDDLAVAAIVCSANGVVMSSAPAGWSQLTLSPVSGNQVTMYVYYKVLVSGDLVGTKTWTVATAQRPCGILVGFSGVDTTTPIEAQDMTNEAAATTHDASAITSLSANAWILNFWAGRNSAGTPPSITVPGSHTGRGAVATGFGSGQVNTSAAAGTLTTPGAAGTYGPYTASYAISASGGMASLALKPASSPTPNPGQFFAML